LLTLGVNSSLYVIEVGFQLYSQLKKSPHNGTEVLGSSAISTASQTTRLGKGSSVTMMGIKRFDHETKVKARLERRNLQTASQLCIKQVGTGEINQIIESLLKVKVQRITKTYQIET